MAIILSGTAKEVEQQLNSMVAYYGKDEFIGNIIANENAIGETKNE